MAQIHRLAAVGQQQGVGRLHGSVAHQFFGEGHQVLVVPIRGVELHHGELGVVTHRDAFVAEVAVDLKHTLKPTHDQSFQVQLWRDAQEHLLVQRVVVRGEGLGVCTAGDGVQHRRFNFEEVVLHHEITNTADRFASRHKALASGLVRHQIDVALAVFDLLVSHAVELVGHGPQALGQHADAGGVDRQLTRTCFEQLAFASHDVAQVPVFEVGVQLFAHVIAGHVNLDAAGAVLQRGKAGLAHHALEHHAARHLGELAFFGQHLGGLVAMQLVQSGSVVRGLEIVGEGHALARGLTRAHDLELLAALGHELVFVDGSGFGSGGGVVVRHLKRRE